MATRGRPSKYVPEYDDQAYKLCLLGATDQEMADFFDVSESTINKWKLDHKSFSESIKSGKEIADSNVADRLYQRALGYSHPEDKIFNNNGEAMVVPTTKHYPPDTTACIFWLKNRRKGEWRDKHDHEVTGRDGEPLFRLPEDRKSELDDEIQNRRNMISGDGARNGTTSPHE